MKLPKHIREQFRQAGRQGGLKRDPNTIPPERRRKLAEAAATARWSRTTPEERSAFARRVAAKRKANIKKR